MQLNVYFKIICVERGNVGTRKRYYYASALIVAEYERKREI